MRAQTTLRYPSVSQPCALDSSATMAPEIAEPALVEHLRAAAPWGVHVAVEVEATGAPFEGATDGPAYQAMASAMQEAFRRPMERLGQGGSIPLCTALEETFPEAEIILIGVEEPQTLIHAPDESVDPHEIAGMALTEALFLEQYAAVPRWPAAGAVPSHPSARCRRLAPRGRVGPPRQGGAGADRPCAGPRAGSPANVPHA